METTTQTLKEYYESKGLTIQEFAKITGVPAVTVYRIQDDRRANIRVNTIRKIYNGTKKYFGTPLDLWDYIDVS